MRIRVSMLAAALLVGSAPVIQAQTISVGVKVGIDFSSLPNAGEVIDQVVKQPSTETSSKVGVLFGGLVTEANSDFKTLLADRIYAHVLNSGALTPARNDARLAARMQ